MGFQILDSTGSLKIVPTTLNATNLTSGTVPDARLSANVPLINAANVFTADQRVNGAIGVNIAPNATDGTLSLSDGIFERSRSVKLGAWTEVAYNAANFTTSGGGAWTVDSGDQRAYGFAYAGTTMFVRVSIADSDVSASPGISLQIPLPDGKTAVKEILVPNLYTDASGTLVWGYVHVGGGASTMLFRKIDSSNWTPTTGDNTQVSCNFSLEVS